MSRSAHARLKSGKPKKFNPTTEAGERLAHNLKAPLAALKQLLRKQHTIAVPNDHRKLLSMAVDRIDEITRSVLQQDSQKSRPLLRKHTLNELKLIVQESLVECIGLHDHAAGSSSPEVVFYNFTDLQRARSKDSTFVLINEVELKNILFTVFENSFDAFAAAKTENAQIKVSTYLSEGKLQFEIQDNGCGIDPQLLPQLAKKGSTFKPQGNGLGLFFAKETLASWGASLEMHSASGRGATTIISVPVAQETVH